MLLRSGIEDQDVYWLSNLQPDFRLTRKTLQYSLGNVFNDAFSITVGQFFMSAYRDDEPL